MKIQGGKRPTPLEVVEQYWVVKIASKASRICILARLSNDNTALTLNSQRQD